MSQSKIMLGNAAIAQGAYEAGVKVSAAYPGTPSTEISECIVKYPEVYAEWSPNEKVAMEVAIGASWGCSRSQGLGCSPIKAVRELGSERRETVRSLSGVGVGYLRGAVLSTRGPGWTGRWCIG